MNNARPRFALAAVMALLVSSSDGWAQFKMKITFSGYDRGEPLTNFPALVVFNTNLQSFAYSQFASPDGFDLRFMDAGKSQFLPYEIEEWNGQGASYVWVRVPSLATNTDCIWAYWGYPLAAQRQAYTTNGVVWTNAYRGVWHMTEPNVRDSTAYTNTGTAIGPVTTVAGQVGPAQEFSQPNHTYVDLGHNGSLNVQSNLTLSSWLNHNPSLNVGFWRFVYSAGILTPIPGSFSYNYGISGPTVMPPTNRWYTEFVTGAGNCLSGRVAADQVGQWHHLAFVFDYGANTACIYLDGALSTNTTPAPGLLAYADTFYIVGG